MSLIPNLSNGRRFPFEHKCAFGNHRGITSIGGYRFRSASLPGRSPKRKSGRALFGSGPSPHVVAKLLFDFGLSRPCRRPIAFTEAPAASAIPPLKETRSQVIAAAIAANQFVRFRLTALLLRERPCKLGLSRSSLLPDRLLTGRPRRDHRLLDRRWRASGR
jgi:hypothetical protein